MKGARTRGLLGSRRVHCAAVTALAVAGIAPWIFAQRAPANVPAVPAHEGVSQPAADISTSLAAAIGRFDRAVEARVGSASRGNADVKNARTGLDREIGAYVLAIVPLAPPARVEEFSRNARQHQQEGAALLQAADQRRALEREYSAVMDSLGAQVQSRIDRGWKFMGRVVARQYLVELQRAMEDLRLRSERLLAAHAHDNAAMAALGASIGRFSSLLDTHARGLASSEGSEWLGQLQSGIARIRSLSQRLDSLDRSRSVTLPAFQSAGFVLASGAHALTAQSLPADQGAAASTQVASALAPKPGHGGWLLLMTGAIVLSSLLLLFFRTAVRAQIPVRRFMVARHTREFRHLAAHDPLTNLPNRRQLVSHLQSALEQAQRAGDRVAVLFIDLDDFRTINDSVGHEFGDRVLVGFAAQVSRLAGPAAFVARPGGDEFAIVQQVARDEADPAAFGQQLLHAFARSVRVDGRELSLSISAGVAVYPDHAGCAETLLSAADAAVFHAKASGRDRLSVFSPPLIEAASRRFNIEQGLRRAIERDELELVYQPEVSARTFRVSALEALVRWRMSDGTLVLPGQFLAVAEETGMICDLGHWVLQRAIETAARWRCNGQADVRMAINVSARQLRESGFASRVTGLLAAAGLPASSIELELTEDALQTGSDTIEVLRALHAAGIAVALDDFGAGYSSLASLEQLPLSRVKLDRSLIAGMHTSERSRAITKSVANLCRKLGLEITAEGIEHREQLSRLLPEKAMHLQGFLIARPAAAEQVPAIVTGMPQHMASVLGYKMIDSSKARAALG